MHRLWEGVVTWRLIAFAAWNSSCGYFYSGDSRCCQNRGTVNINEHLSKYLLSHNYMYALRTFQSLKTRLSTTGSIQFSSPAYIQHLLLARKLSPTHIYLNW